MVNIADLEQKQQVNAMKDKIIAKRLKTLESKIEELQDVPYASVIIKATTGNPATGNTGVICINTADNTIKIYAEGDWRTIGTY